MKLYELLNALKDSQDVDIYMDHYDENHTLDYHIYGRNAYVSQAYDLSLYFNEVKSVTTDITKLNRIVIKIECVS